MTHQIDSRYMLDEVNLIGDIVLALSNDPAFDSDSMPRGRSVHFIALVDELRERKQARQRVQPGKRGLAQPDDTRVDLNNIDEKVEALRELPSLRSMRTILTAHLTARKAREMKIEQKLQHVAQGANAPILKTTDEAEGEEREALIEQRSPRLSDEDHEAWGLAKKEIVDRVEALNVEQLHYHYGLYLKNVLDRFAMGEDQRIINQHAETGLTKWNEPNTEWVDTTDEGLEHQYLDTFWYRQVQIFPNPNYDSTQPSHAAEETVEYKARNPAYIASILFEPREAGLGRVAVVAIKDIESTIGMDGVSLSFVGEYSYTKLIKIPVAHWNEHKKRKWLAINYTTPNVYASSDHRTEAMVAALRPKGPAVHPKFVRQVRQLSDVEKAELTRVTAEPRQFAAHEELVINEMRKEGFCGVYARGEISVRGYSGDGAEVELDFHHNGTVRGAFTSSKIWTEVEKDRFIAVLIPHDPTKHAELRGGADKSEAIARLWTGQPLSSTPVLDTSIPDNITGPLAEELKKLLAQSKEKEQNSASYQDHAEALRLHEEINLMTRGHNASKMRRLRDAVAFEQGRMMAEDLIREMDKA